MFGGSLYFSNLFGSATNITIGTGGKLDINKTSQNLSTARIHVTGAGTIDVNSTGFAAYNPLILTVGEIAVDTGGLLTFANWAGDKDTGLGSTRIVTTLAPGTVIEGVKFGSVDSAYAIAYRNTDSQVVLIPFDALFVWKGQTLPSDTWTADNWMLEAGTPITGKYADQSSARVIFTANSFTKTGAGAFTLNHANTYTGGTARWYADLVAKANYYETDFDSTSTYGDKTSADYDQWAGGVSLEIGKQLVSAKGWFAEPQFQFSYGRIQGQDYTAKGPIPVDVALEKQDSFQVRGGVRFGKNIATTLGTLQPYAKASAAGMWTDGGHVRTEDGLSRRATLDGGRMELGAGLVWETNGAGQIYLDYEYVRAERFEIPWKLNAGYRIQW